MLRNDDQLIRYGLIGGKVGPMSAARHPAVFTTCAAPFLGLVHMQGHRTVAITIQREAAEAA
ncbi:hypothetical protein ACIBF1_30075 [Spirillospora sp. NPDC050679]